VVLSHANLLANIRAMREAGWPVPDVFVSWLPLYHDMGLIGSWLLSLTAGHPVRGAVAAAFLTRPVRWLQAIHEHGGTVSGGPNFGYELCLRRIDDAELEGLDLRSWRIAFNGAEPVSPDTVTRFIERFARSGSARRDDARLRARGVVGRAHGARRSGAARDRPVAREPLVARNHRSPCRRRGADPNPCPVRRLRDPLRGTRSASSAGMGPAGRTVGGTGPVPWAVRDLRVPPQPGATDRLSSTVGSRPGTSGTSPMASCTSPAG
jgi:acyl-CoA synthetase (AMP-forming)/AMP-acid ligase II